MKDKYGNEWAGNTVFNPGTFGMNDASESQAIANMTAFIDDCDFPGRLSASRVPGHDYGEGRYAFAVQRIGFKQVIEVQMPGRDLERVRYINEDQNIWDFPRLYVDDSSWAWLFAVIKDESWLRRCAHCQSHDTEDQEGTIVWHCYDCGLDFFPTD